MVSSLLKTLTVAVCVLACAPLPTSAQELYMRSLDLLGLAAEDPDAALVEVDATLSAAQAEELPDVRLIYDLVRLKADIFLDQDKYADAARLIIELAGFTAQNRETLRKDPIPLHNEAIEILLELGELRAARRQVTAILEAQRDGAEPGPVLSQTLERLAALSDEMGQTEQADRYRTQAANALAEEAPTRGAPGEGYRGVEVFYATDRARTGSNDPEDFYGWGRGELELGTAIVTIPDTHTGGFVETPSIWKLEFAPNPAKHVVLRSVTPVAEDAYYKKMQERVSERPNKELFVLIHGYNVDFAQAAKRAAQISHDMSYGGVPVLYSWPSAGSVMGYISDTAVVRLSGRRLSGFLEDLVARSGAETVHIVAHSMGNRALTDALELLAVGQGVTEDSEPMFGQILFAAPDVDAGLFTEMIETIRPLAQRLTLYASFEDWALEASRRLHGNAPRAGQGGEFVLIDDNFDSVDMSELGEDMLAHSYFADESSALADIMSLFWRDASPQRRCGLQETRNEGIDREFWTYRQGTCSSKTLIDAMALMARKNVQSADEVRAALKDGVDDLDVRRQLEPVLLRMVAE